MQYFVIEILRIYGFVGGWGFDDEQGAQPLHCARHCEVVERFNVISSHPNAKTIFFEFLRCFMYSWEGGLGRG